MQLKLLIIMLFTLSATFSKAQFSNNGTTKWTVEEAKTWIKEIKERDSRWKGWLLYRGSDNTYHYFVTRRMDENVRFQFKRSELKLEDERVYSRASSAPLGYYYVDPLDDFKKMRDL